MLAKRLTLVLALLVAFSLVLAACGPTPAPEPEAPEVEEPEVEEEEEEEVIDLTAILPAEEMVPCLPLPEIAMGRGAGVSSQASSYFGIAPRQEGVIYRVGVFEDVTTDNYWAANGPDNTVWNAYMLPMRLALFILSDQSFDLIPQAAAIDAPPALVQEGDYWVVEVPLVGGITWTDGVPFTAEDVAFTANTALKFGLISGNWSAWYDGNYIDHVEAVDDLTVKFYFHTEPGLARYEWGCMQAPILPAHFWQALVDEAAAPIDALGADASEEDMAAAQAEATNNLYVIDATGEPQSGAFEFTRWEPGAFLETATYEDYFQEGTVVTEYANGAVSVAGPAGDYVYGDTTGDVSLEYEVGPFVETVIYTYYGSQDAALLALKAGEVDFILNPLGLQRGLLDIVEGDENITVLQNPVNGFRYMSFNVRRRPMNDCSFRQAVAALIDKEYVTQTVLQGIAFPLYSYVPEANAAWYYDEVPKIGIGLSRPQRLELAVAILEQAGFSWEGDQKPAYDEENDIVLTAGRLILPDGAPCPDLSLWAPSAGYDPLRSTFAIHIERWLQEVGIPITARLAGFNTLIPIIFTEQSFDMYILGWSLTLFPDYLRDFWHTEQAVVDGNNAGGYSNPEFDALSTTLLECKGFEECREIADRCQEILATEVPYVLLFDTGIIEPYRQAAVEYPYTAHLSGLQYTHQQGYLQSEVNVK
jgi:peptide/nickel transport system substrate-binding protein